MVEAMRQKRVIEFCRDAQQIYQSKPLDKEISDIKLNDTAVSNAKFLMKYLENVSSRTFAQYFCGYSDKMFATVSATKRSPMLTTFAIL